MSATLAVGRGPTPRWLILFVLVDTLIVLSIIGWVAVREDGTSATQRAEQRAGQSTERSAVRAQTPQQLADALLAASRSERRVEALTALCSRRGLGDEELNALVVLLDETIGAASVLEVSLTPLEADALLEYERDGVRYAPNLTPEGRIRLHQADLTHTSVLYGRDSNGYRIAFASTVR